MNPGHQASGTAAGAAAAPVVASGWLARLHPGLFGIPMGLLGLAGTWARLGRPTPEAPSGVATMSMAIAALGALIWAVLCVLWLAKWLRHHEQVHGMWRHPLQGSFLALVPVSTLLVVTYYAPLSAGTPWRESALALLGAALLLQLAIAWQVVSQLTTGRITAELVTPALYLPPVAGGFVGAMALQALGFHGWAVLLFGIGLGGWALLEARILHRLFAGPLPLALRPTLGLEMAPTSVGALTLALLWPELPADVLLVALGIGTGPVLAVLSRWRWWTEAPFSPGFWSFSFPIAAYAGVVVEAVHRGGWSVAVAWLATLLATAVIGYLALRTLALWRAGRLLPAA